MVPSFLMILLTHKCNLKCKYCYLGDKDSIPDNDKVMTSDTLSKCVTNLAIDYVKNECDNKITIQFAGGEPTLLGAETLDKYYSIVENILKDYDIPYNLSIITNGVYLTQDIIDVLKKHSVGTCVSFDGVTNVDRYTEESECKKVLESINLLDKSEFSKNIHTVITNNTKETFFKECSNNISNYEGLTSATLVADSNNILNLSAEDSLKYYYIPALQSFLDGKVKNIEGFFNLGPGRYLLKYLTDRFTFHTDSCKTSCGAKYCGGGINLAAISPDGYWQMCADFRGDEDFFNGRIYNAKEMDFLNLKKLQTNMNFTLKTIPILNKCDNCVHQYYCNFPCLKYIRKSTGKWEMPEKYCKITKELYKWYENHLNSIFKAIYLYCEGHRIYFKEDYVLKPFSNIRFSSNYFNIHLIKESDTERYFLMVTRK